MKYSGINKEFYDDYFSGKDEGHAIKIKKPKRYSKYMELHDYNVKQAPQSFIYLNAWNIWETIMQTGSPFSWVFYL